MKTEKDIEKTVDKWLWPCDRMVDILMLIGWGRRGLETIRRYRRRYR